MSRVYIPVTILLFAILSSCSGSDIVPTAPIQGQAEGYVGGNSICVGYWTVVAERDTGELDIVRHRMSDGVLNVLGFLEPPAMTGLSIDFNTLFIDFDTGELQVDVLLKHPLPDPQFNGFDVRGVVFGPKVIDSDGYTPVMAPKYFEGVPFGYMNGLLGVPNSTAGFDGDLHGYKYFCDGLGANSDVTTFFSNQANVDKRGMFTNGDTLKRKFHLRWPGSGYNILVFNYAVYANYDWPVGAPPITLDDFPITTANSQEAFCGKISETSNSLYYSNGTGGGTISLNVEIWDWQDNLIAITVQSVEPGVIDEVGGGFLGQGSTTKSHVYSFNDIPAYANNTGELDLIIKVYDEWTFGMSWFLDLLPTSNPLYGEYIYNCFMHTTMVVDCPPPLISTIDPDTAWSGQTVDMTLTGVFNAGPQLAVKMTLSGQPDIVATDVLLDGVSGDITCTFDLTGAVDGDWTVVVTNGCGTDGDLPDGFILDGCDGQKACPTGSFSYTDHFAAFIHYPERGTEITRDSSTQYLICTGFRSTIRYRIFAYRPMQTDYDYMCELIDDDRYLPYSMAVSTTDRIYYVCADAMDEIQYIDFTGTGFGPLGQPFGVPVPWGSIRRVSIDENNNPVVLCYTGSGATFALRIYHWNGTSWGTAISVPSEVGSQNSNWYYAINDFEYNPVTGDYLITTYYDPPKFYAVDSTGTMVYSDTDIWSTSGSGDDIFTGICIDRDSPECRFILNGAPYIPYNGPHSGVTYFARCNPVYEEWTFVTTPVGSYPYRDGRGSVVDVGGTDYFCGTSSYRWYSTYIAVPEW